MVDITDTTYEVTVNDTTYDVSLTVAGITGSLNTLSDVTISSPVSGEGLIFNGTSWVNQTGSGTDDMTKAVYDPSNIASDVFDMDNMVEGSSSFILTATERSNIASNTTNNHTHSNKTLLDSYTQTEVDLADAVSKKHSHSNLTVLDNTTASFTTADETKIDFITVTQDVDLDTIESDTASNNSFRTTPSTVITAGSGIAWSGNTLNVSASGTGDMTKAVYDTDDSGIVDDAEMLNGQSASYYLDYNNFTNTPSIPSTTDDLTEGSTNLYYTDVRVSANSDVSANTADRHTHSNKANLDVIDQDLATSDDVTFNGVTFTGNTLTYSGTGDFNLDIADGLIIKNGQTASFRLLGWGNDIYFQNTVSTGNIVFSTTGGVQSNGTALFNIDNTKFNGDVYTTGDITVDGTVDGVDVGTDVPLNTTHRTSDGSDHSFIDQDVTAGSSPTFDGANITGIDAENVDIVDTNDYYTSTNVEGALAELGAVRSWVNGYDLQNTSLLPDIAFDTSTRVVTVSVKSGNTSFCYWADGKKYTKTSSDTVTIPDTTDVYYVYYDDNEVLQYVSTASFDYDLIYKYALTALIYWNKTQGAGYIGSEMHGVRMSPSTHAYNHKTYGARYQDGLNIEGLSSGGSTYTQTTSGHFWDEDIVHSVTALSTHPFLYRLGTSGEWTISTASNEVSFNNGDSYDVWNEYTGTTWQLTEGTSSTDYWIIFYTAIPNESGQQVYKIIGQNAYSSRSKARDAISSEINALVTNGLPSEEFVFLYATIVKRTGALQALADGSLYLDLRSDRGATGSGTNSSYADDIITDTSNFDSHLSSTDTTVQIALDTLDDHTHIYSQVTDFQVGVEAYSINNIVEDTTPQLGGSLDRNNKSITTIETAGESLVAGDLCYLKSDGKYWKADASAESTASSDLLLCNATISADAIGEFIEFGEYTTTGLTAGSKYYVSETGGAFTATVPTTSSAIVRIVGYALSTTVLKFRPDSTYIELS